MKLTTKSFEPNARIPVKYAFGAIDPETHVKLAPNLNPHLAWEAVPQDTRSLVLICHDSDAPSEGETVNQEGKEVPASLARVDFFHWVLVDIDPARGQIEEGEFSDGVVATGKEGPEAPEGMRHGLNDYTGWFAGDADMEGKYFGYDGPCPPWNDTLIHHYHFTLYAVDLERCPVQGAFTGADVRRAIEGHILAQASITGTYTLNPELA